VSEQFVIEIVGEDEIDRVEGNVDVNVYFSDGRKYAATFFTLSNLHSLMEKDRSTGECAGGLYFWASDMIIVEQLDREIIEKTVASLLAQGEFDKAFGGPHRID